MHLDHKIPWKTISSHFTFTQADNAYDVVALNTPTERAEMGHFQRVFAATIREFSSSELPKADLDHAPNPLFSDAVLRFAESHYGLGAHHENSATSNPLAPSHQDLSYWRRRAATDDPSVQSLHSTSNADLGDATKMLVIAAAVNPDEPRRREALGALLYLSSQVPLAGLRSLTWGHGFGLDLVAGTALESYVLLNLVEAMLPKAPAGVSLLQVRTLTRFLQSYALQDYDYPAQNVPHRAFWGGLGYVCSGDTAGAVDPLAAAWDDTHQKAREDLKQYLKDCFSIVYVYNVFLTQAVGAEQAEEFWMSELDGIFGFMGCLRRDE